MGSENPDMNVDEYPHAQEDNRRTSKLGYPAQIRNKIFVYLACTCSLTKIVGVLNQKASFTLMQ